MDHLVFRQRGSQLGHLARAQPGLHLVPHGPVVTTRLARDIMKHDTLHVTRGMLHVTPTGHLHSNTNALVMSFCLSALALLRWWGP